jgi:hypothetical protein
VLGKWSEGERAEPPHLPTRVGNTVKAFVTMELAMAMNMAAK